MLPADEGANAPWLELGFDNPELCMIRNRLAELREAKGLTQEALGELIGTSESTISRLESGATKMNDDYLARLSRALGCHPAVLITDDPVAVTDDQRTLLRLVANLSNGALDALIASARQMA